MRFDKALTARVNLQENTACTERFETLLAEIENLPAEVKGAQALSFAARLVELAAYSLAGEVDSARVGALIRQAAELTEQASDVAELQICGCQVPHNTLQ